MFEFLPQYAEQWTHPSDVSQNLTYKFSANPLSLFKEEDVKAYAEKVKKRFADGFQWQDIPAALEYTIELVAQTLDVSNAKDFIIKIVNKVIDITDTPYLPDGPTDPLLKKLAEALIHFTFNIFEGKFSSESAVDKFELNAAPADRIDLKGVSKEIAALFQDGFQLGDVIAAINLSLDFMLKYSELDVENKKETIVNLINEVIDETDTPYLPDSFSDPLFKIVVPSLVDFMMSLKGF